MEIGTEQTVFYITEREVESYRRAGFSVKAITNADGTIRERGDGIKCFLAIEPT